MFFELENHVFVNLCLVCLHGCFGPEPLVGTSIKMNLWCLNYSKFRQGQRILALLPNFFLWKGQHLIYEKLIHESSIFSKTEKRKGKKEEEICRFSYAYEVLLPRERAWLTLLIHQLFMNIYYLTYQDNNNGLPYSIWLHVSLWDNSSCYIYYLSGDWTIWGVGGGTISEFPDCIIFITFFFVLTWVMDKAVVSNSFSKTALDYVNYLLCR